MRTALKEAGEIAIRELKMGRTSLLLLPDSKWTRDAIQLGQPPRGVFIGIASRPSSLEGYCVDTLITVGLSRIPLGGLLTAKRRLVWSHRSKWIDVGETLTTKEGEEIWP